MVKSCFFANFKVLVKQGYLELATASFSKNKDNTDNKNNDNGENQEQETFDENLINMVKQLKKRYGTWIWQHRDKRRGNITT